MLSNSSQLCPSGNLSMNLKVELCKPKEFQVKESLAGRITIDTGDSKKAMEFLASWKTVEELEKNDANIKVIKGILDLGTSQFSP